MPIFGALRAAAFVADRRQAMVDPWTEAARALGLTDVQVTNRLAGARLRGRKGPFTVELSGRYSYRAQTATSVPTSHR